MQGFDQNEHLRQHPEVLTVENLSIFNEVFGQWGTGFTPDNPYDKLTVDERWLIYQRIMFFFKVPEAYRTFEMRHDQTYELCRRLRVSAICAHDIKSRGIEVGAKVRRERDNLEGTILEISDAFKIKVDKTQYWRSSKDFQVVA